MRKSKVAHGSAGVVILAALNRFGYLLEGLGKTAEQIESQDVPQGEKPIAEAANKSTWIIRTQASQKQIMYIQSKVMPRMLTIRPTS